MKRLTIAWLILVCTVLCLFNASAFAEAHNSGGFRYEVQDDGTCVITSYTGNAVRIDIPQSLDGHQVTAIGDNAFRCDSFNSDNSHIISLPDGIVSIGDFAFYQANVSYINIPDSVESIGIGAFAGCPTCKFAIDGSQKYYAVIDNCLYSKNDKMLIAATFEYMYSKELVIPEGIIKIGDYACYRYCKYIGNAGMFGITLQIPKSLKEIGNYAFTACRVCPSPDFFSNITSIGDYAFSKGYIYIGSSEVELDFSADLSRLGEGAFDGVDCPDIILDFSQCKLDYIPNNAFANTTSIRVRLPENVTSIGSRAFASFKGLTKLSNGNLYRVGLPMIPSGVTEIGESCYENAESYHLSNCTIPGSIRILPVNAYKGLQTGSSTVKIIVEEGVVRIESKALAISSTKSIKNGTMSIYLPQSIEYIANDAMTSDFSLTFYVIRDSYAENWCIRNNYKYTYQVNEQEQEQDTSWLNN